MAAKATATHRLRQPMGRGSSWLGGPPSIAQLRARPARGVNRVWGSDFISLRPSIGLLGRFQSPPSFPCKADVIDIAGAAARAAPPIDRSGPRFRLYSRVSGLPPGRLWRSRNVVVGPQCRKFVRFEAAFGTWFSNGGGHMIKILLTVAVLGCVGGFAGLAMAQGKPGEALGRDISSQCAHRRTMPPDPRDACGRNQRSDTQVGSGQDGSSQAALVGPGPGGGQGNGIGPGNAGNQGNAIGPANAGGQGNGIGPGNGGGQGKGRR